MNNQQAIEQELERIDDLVDAWHEGNSHLPLSAFLEMTTEAYQLWVRSPKHYAALKLGLLPITAFAC